MPLLSSASGPQGLSPAALSIRLRRHQSAKSALAPVRLRGEIHPRHLQRVECDPDDAYGTGAGILAGRWAAHLSFAAVVDLLNDVLPVDRCLQVETVRRHLFATAERLEAELGPEQFAYDAGCQLEIEASPEPGPPITVGLDGGYTHGRERRPGAAGCFEVIAGKSIPEEGAAKVFAGARRVDTKPRRLHEVLRSQGVLPRQ